MPETPGSLIENLLLFGRLLRELGLDVDTGRMIDLVQALNAIEIGNKPDFYYTLRGLLVHRREAIPIFDQAFALFWQSPLSRWQHPEGPRARSKRRSNRPVIIPPPLKEPETKGPPPGGNE